MWLLFALLSPLFWAIVHILDRHCVERIFDRPWFGVITGALATVVIFPFALFALLVVPLELPTWEFILWALLAGALVQLSQVFYFQSLNNSEAGIVAAYLNTVPALLPVASYLLQGTILKGWHYTGIMVLVVSSICFSLLDTNRQTRQQTFWFMLLASVLQVGALLIEKHVFEHSTFLAGFLTFTIGLVLSGLMPLAIPNIRSAFIRNLATLRPAIPIIIGIEMANLIALFMSQRAIDLGIPSLVAAVEASIPGYTFLLTMAWVSRRKKFSENEVGQKIGLKLLLVAVMAIGVWLVS
jgi:uncharacterized membrane protein